MKIIIRQANEKDTKLIQNLSWQTFFDTYHKENSKEDMEVFLSTNFTYEVVSKELTDNANTFLVAYDMKQPAGYVKLTEGTWVKHLETDSSLEIARIYAVKEKIGRGVGKVLMEQCIAIAKERGKQVVWLRVWEKNQRAIQFYRRWGFEKFGEEIFLLGRDVQDDWLMKRKV